MRIYRTRNGIWMLRTRLGDQWIGRSIMGLPAAIWAELVERYHRWRLDLW